MATFPIRHWIFCLLLLVAGSSSGADTVFGRYSGIFRHEGIKRDQLAKLDLILSREDGNTYLMKAILTLQFGDFRSGEYVAYHFDNVKYYLLTGTFVFDQADQPVTLVGKLASTGEFTGDFRSIYAGETGKLRLRIDGAVVPELPLIEPVWGEYRGRCRSKVASGSVDTVLQLHTYRSTEGAGQVGNPFRSYKVKGFLGERSANGCLGGKADYCVWGNVHSGAYNFFENRLYVYNNYRNLSCTPRPDGLDCDGCDFLRRVSGETAEPRALTPPATASGFHEAKAEGKSVVSGAIDSIQGMYRGYLHHEYLDRYQPARLSVLTFQDGSPEKPKLRLSAAATLYFGGFGSPESISYRFAERSYPMPLEVTQFLFDNADPSADVDAILEVTTIGDGVVKGIWFSRLFGKVGDFALRKDAPPAIPDGARMMELVSGHYAGPEWELDILVGLGSAQVNTENPFAPLTFDGWTMLPGVTGKNTVTGGSYDFYTGRIGIETGESAVHLGKREARESLSMRRLGAAVMAALPDFALQPHRLIAEPRTRSFRAGAVANR